MTRLSRTSTAAKFPLRLAVKMSALRTHADTARECACPALLPALPGPATARRRTRAEHSRPNVLRPRALVTDPAVGGAPRTLRPETANPRTARDPARVVARGGRGVAVIEPRSAAELRLELGNQCARSAPIGLRDRRDRRVELQIGPRAARFLAMRDPRHECPKSTAVVCGRAGRALLVESSLTGERMRLNDSSGNVELLLEVLEPGTRSRERVVWELAARRDGVDRADVIAALDRLRALGLVVDGRSTAGILRPVLIAG